MSMPDPTEPVFRCRDCGKGIEDGERMWSVNIHCETLDGGAITVHQAECYNYVFCEPCALRCDFRHIEIPLRVAGGNHDTRLTHPDAPSNG